MTTPADKRMTGRRFEKLAKQLYREADEDEFKEWLSSLYSLPAKERIAFLRGDNKRVKGLNKDLQDLTITIMVDRYIQDEELPKTSAFNRVSSDTGITENTIAKIYYEHRSR